MLQCPRDFMRNVILSAMLLITGLAPARAADPTGDWRVADGVANIRIAECNGSMWGVVAWEKNPGGRDTNNPDASKKNRPTLGMPILIDMKKKPGHDQWEGRVYNAKDGRIYSSTIKPTGPDQLEIQGCLLGFLWLRNNSLRSCGLRFGLRLGLVTGDPDSVAIGIVSGNDVLGSGWAASYHRRGADQDGK